MPPSLFLTGTLTAVLWLALLAVPDGRSREPDEGVRWAPSAAHRPSEGTRAAPSRRARWARGLPAEGVAVMQSRRPRRERRRAAPAPSAAPVPAASRAVGLPWDGRLVGGRQLAPEGEHFFTWDPILRIAPNRPWRRYGTDRLLRTLKFVIEDYAHAHPEAPRVGIGDLSRPRGGDFGPRFGRPGHASHQNGLDADVYYPRLDRLEAPPQRAREVDRRLAQALVDRFVAAGARFVFVGPRTGLVGPRKVVQVLPRYHDNHMHVRIRG